MHVEIPTEPMTADEWSIWVHKYSLFQLRNNELNLGPVPPPTKYKNILLSFNRVVDPKVTGLIEWLDLRDWADKRAFGNVLLSAYLPDDAASIIMWHEWGHVRQYVSMGPEDFNTLVSFSNMQLMLLDMDRGYSKKNILDDEETLCQMATDYASTPLERGPYESMNNHFKYGDFFDVLGNYVVPEQFELVGLPEEFA